MMKLSPSTPYAHLPVWTIEIVDFPGFGEADFLSCPILILFFENVTFTALLRNDISIGNIVIKPT